VLAFSFLSEHAGVATSLLHGEALGYGGHSCSRIVSFSQNDIISWMWSVLWLAIVGIASSVELSRRGAHLWVFLAGRVSAAQVRRWLLPYCPPGVEFFPKQEQSSGYGSLMHMPLGVHRLTGRQYPFVIWQDASLVPVAASIAGVLSWLASVERVIVPHERTLPMVEPVRERDPHTSLTKSGPAVPPLPSTSINAWCAAQDPFDLIGQYVELDRRGMGQCPFGAHHSDGTDRHPSFRVYAPARPGGCCWHCYTVGRSGNVFNFLQMYYGLDAKTLWSRILAGEVF
jgi:hypothetical protein